MVVSFDTWWRRRVTTWLIEMADDCFGHASGGEKVTLFRFRHPSPQSPWGLNGRRIEGKSGSTKFESLCALGAQRRASTEQCCFCGMGDVMTFK